MFRSEILIDQIGLFIDIFRICAVKIKKVAFIFSLFSFKKKSKQMIIYRVSCTMSKDIGKRWERFFIEKHLDDVVNTGYFTGYSFRKVIEMKATEEVTYVSEYFCPNMESLEAYNKTAAPALKKEVIELFDGKFRASRELLEEV